MKISRMDREDDDNKDNQDKKEKETGILDTMEKIGYDEFNYILYIDCNICS